MDRLRWRSSAPVWSSAWSVTANRPPPPTEHADAALYEGRQVILTPTERTLTAQLQKAQDLWTALGCRVTSMSPESHDAAFAAVSHLPHLLAFSLMNSISGQANGEAFLALAGPGFRDFTRIAASDPKVWRDILLANREELLTQTQLFQQALKQFENAMRSDSTQSIEDMITLASETRTHWRMSTQKSSPHR